MGSGRSKDLVLETLYCHTPLSFEEIRARSGLSRNQVNSVLYRVWRQGCVLRSRKPLYEHGRVSKGRAGLRNQMRPYYLYLLRPEGVESCKVDGRVFVCFDEKYLDPRGGRGKSSKAYKVLRYLQENMDRAFFSVEIVEALKEHGVLIRDIMVNVRRYEKKGLVYVRGYKSENRQTPFQEGFLLTALDQGLPRDQAIREAVARTDLALQGRSSSSPIMERVHRIRDIVIEYTLMRKILGPSYLESELGCTNNELRGALERALQLYPDIKVVKIFDAYRYLYHDSMDEVVLAAAVEMKKNYLRIEKGSKNRIGHNWEAVAEWFIDKTTSGVHFWTQNHRRGRMDPRRITIHLIKGVGKRRRAAEMDRIWDVTPGVFAPPITYVLNCKWGLVAKKHVDEFLEVLRWSKDFGVDTPEGRVIKNGVTGVFAASAFNPKETVRLIDESTISLASYAARRNLQLITGADFNKMLRERGCVKTATVQKICRYSRNEDQVRATLDKFWEKPKTASNSLKSLLESNREVFQFEKMLEAAP